jgi:hypothetical protein
LDRENLIPIESFSVMRMACGFSPPHGELGITVLMDNTCREQLREEKRLRERDDMPEGTCRPADKGS